MSKSQPKLEPLNVKIPRDLKRKLKTRAKLEHRSMQAQLLCFLEKGLSHLSEHEDTSACDPLSFASGV
jgi:plasmid stability protein